MANMGWLGFCLGFSANSKMGSLPLTMMLIRLFFRELPADGSIPTDHKSPCLLALSRQCVFISIWALLHERFAGLKICSRSGSVVFLCVLPVRFGSDGM